MTFGVSKARLFKFIIVFGVALPVSRVHAEISETSSIGLGWHDQGFLQNFVWTADNGFGFFAGMAWHGKSKKNQPSEAHFYWIDYSKKEEESRAAFFGGLAYQLIPEVTLGLGYGWKYNTYYRWGYDVTGTRFRLSEEIMKSANGIAGLVEIRITESFGAQVVFGVPGFGGALAFRY